MAEIQNTGENRNVPAYKRLLTEEYWKIPDEEFLKVINDIIKEIKSGKVELIQNATASCDVIGTGDFELFTQTKNDIKQTMKQVATQSNEAKQEFAAFAAAMQDQNLIIDGSVNTAIDTIVDTAVNVECKNIQSAYNETKNIVICAVPQGGFIYEQDALATARTQCGIDILNQMSTQNVVEQFSSQDGSQENIIEQLGPLGAILAIIAAIIVLALIIGGIYLATKSSGKKSGNDNNSGDTGDKSE